MRIASLVPAGTEIVCALGAGDRLVAVTHDCDHPEYVRALPRLTRTTIPEGASSGEIDGLEVDRRGNNDTHKIRLRGAEWSCECEHFSVHGLCTHVMTLQRLFATHLSEAQRFTQERVTA